MLSVAIIPESISYHVPHISPLFLMTFLAWGIIFVWSFVAIRKSVKIPGKWQLSLESILNYVANMADEMIGHEAFKFYPLFMGLFVFILVGNLIGLVPGLISPTSDPNTTFALAIIVFVYFNAVGIKKQGLKYFKQFLGPKMPWYMFPISFLLILTEIITFFTRPFSLGLRLFCNIFSKELFLQILAILAITFALSPLLADKFFLAAPLLLRPFIVILGLIIGLIQALVFTVLSVSYVAGAIHASEH